MKNLVIFFILLLCSCTYEPEVKPIDPEASARTEWAGCSYKFKFNISQNSTITQVQANAKYNFSVKSLVIAKSDGTPLDPNGPLTWSGGTASFHMWNTGQAAFRYKVGTLGSWITVSPGTSHIFTRPLYLRDITSCQGPVSIQPFTVYTERIECGPMQGTSNHFNAVVQIFTITNGHNSDFSIVGINTSGNCPL